MVRNAYEQHLDKNPANYASLTPLSFLERTAHVEFDHTTEGTPIWGQEAAHSRRRILHVGDATGRAIMNGLVAALSEYPNINIKSEATAVDLITFPHHSRNPLDNYREISCHGCYVFDRSEKTVHRYLANTTILATGGLGRI